MSQLGRYESRTIEASQPEYPWRCKSCGRPEVEGLTGLCEDCLARLSFCEDCGDEVGPGVRSCLDCAFPEVAGVK